MISIEVEDGVYNQIIEHVKFALKHYNYQIHQFIPNADAISWFKNEQASALNCLLVLENGRSNG